VEDDKPMIRWFNVSKLPVSKPRTADSELYKIEGSSKSVALAGSITSELRIRANQNFSNGPAKRISRNRKGIPRVSSCLLQRSRYQRSYFRTLSLHGPRRKSGKAYFAIKATVTIRKLTRSRHGRDSGCHHTAPIATRTKKHKPAPIEDVVAHNKLLLENK
jgi:hypothetical protein